MKDNNRFLRLILVIGMALACSCGSKEPQPTSNVQSDSRRPASNLKDTLPANKPIPNSSDTAFVVIKDISDPKACDLSQDELQQVHALFYQCIAENKEQLLSAESYKRQYFPSVNAKGEKEVWVNCFASDWERNWKSEAIIVMDGGNYFFRQSI